MNAAMEKRRDKSKTVVLGPASFGMNEGKRMGFDLCEREYVQPLVGGIMFYLDGQQKDCVCSICNKFRGILKRSGHL